MGKQVRLAIIGLGIGVLIGVVGGIAGGVPFLVVLLRSIISGLIGALLLYGLKILVDRFLPGLFSDEPTRDPIEDISASDKDIGSNVDIVLPGDVPDDTGDQASGLRAMVQNEAAAGAYLAGEDAGQSFRNPEPADAGEVLENEGVAVDEVPDTTRSSAEDGGTAKAGFSEDAFYSGIEHLPDIGGFSEHFGQTGETSEPVEGESGPALIDTDNSEPAVRSSGGGKSSELDPELMAKAIRTALKRE